MKMTTENFISWIMTGKIMRTISLIAVMLTLISVSGMCLSVLSGTDYLVVGERAFSVQENDNFVLQAVITFLMLVGSIIVCLVAWIMISGESDELFGKKRCRSLARTLEYDDTERHLPSDAISAKWSNRIFVIGIVIGMAAITLGATIACSTKDAVLKKWIIYLFHDIFIYTLPTAVISSVGTAVYLSVSKRQFLKLVCTLRDEKIPDTKAYTILRTTLLWIIRKAKRFSGRKRSIRISLGMKKA